MRTKKIFPDYDLTRTEETGKVVIDLVTQVRCFEINTQKWFLTQVGETTRCEPSKEIQALNDAMGRFIENCYVQMTVGFPSQSVVDKDGDPLFIPDESQISEKERIKNILKKKFGLPVTSSSQP